MKHQTLSNLIEGDQLLEALISIMLRSTERAEKTIDETLEFVTASNKRIEEMELRKP